ncbi:GTP-binding protein rho1 [Coccidioides immitis H538.4]|uniref:GTP-binding protein rho1 n=1 Tax=Coccidioides immitis H538.4 TaxID=396776 RepID=A0A0J8RI26_COCIT|nr:GTP-binding protein rho1 [Coccidioides immitis H538.4]
MSGRAYEEQHTYGGHIRRHSSVVNEKGSSSLSPRRKPVRSQSTRASNGTVSTTMSVSTGRMSQATNITQPPSYSKKFVVVGDGGCGKTCLLISYSQGYFPEDKKNTTDFGRSRIRETDLLFVCFAIDCPVSLENVMDKWYPEVLHFCPTTPLILVGLKSDLRTKRTCIELLKSQGLTPVTPEQGQAVAQRMGALYVECSSKEMRGVDEVFELAVNTAVGIQESSWNSHGGGHQGGGKKIKKRSCKIL